jgi:hydrogenase expression/formation protein HypC
MCLGVPGRVVELDPDPKGVTMGKVSFGGIMKRVCLACVPEARVGDFVVVHVGFAIAMVDQVEAETMLDFLGQLGELDDLI